MNSISWGSNVNPADCPYSERTSTGRCSRDDLWVVAVPAALSRFIGEGRINLGAGRPQVRDIVSRYSRRLSVLKKWSEPSRLSL